MAPAFAQDDAPEFAGLAPGLSVEILPAEYRAVQGDIPEHIKNPPLQWVTIPATYETITVTEMRQGVPREARRRVVKTPSKRVQRRVPSLYTPQIVRQQVTPKTYILRRADGTEVRRFTDPAALKAVLEIEN